MDPIEFRTKGPRRDKLKNVKRFVSVKEIKAKVHRTLRGILFGFLWYSCCIAIFLLILSPSLLIVFISPPIFRKLSDPVCSLTELYLTVLMDIMRIKIVTSGDKFLPNESAILIMNHRTRTDGLFLIKAMYQAVAPRVTSQRLKFIIKATVRHIPFAGWLIQTAGNLFVRRNWKVDEDHLSRWLDYELALNRRCQLVIFPEGTDLTLFTKWRSNKYAKSKGLPEYEYTLHPRSKGFTYLVRRLQQADYLDAIYDITIAYPDRVPQNELDILRGKMPDEVHIHVKRTAQTDLPKDEAVLRNWLENCWTQKESILKEFYANKRFSNDTWPTAVCNRALLWIVICFFIAITIVVWVLVMMSPTFRLWAFCSALLFIGISFYDNGFYHLEMNWYWKWKSLWF